MSTVSTYWSNLLSRILERTGETTDPYKTLLANTIATRMKIMQRPSLADQDAMPSVRSWSGVFCHGASGCERHQCAPDSLPRRSQRVAGAPCPAHRSVRVA